VTAVSAPLPLAAIADLMGVPESHHKQLFEWSNRMIGFDDPEFRTTPEDGELAAIQIVGYAHELGAEKRACPVDDIVTKLISPDESGSQLSELEFDMFFILLAVAGNETTRNAISGGMLALIEHPDQWARLRADPALHPTAADEIVRWVSPVMDFRRTVMADTRIGEQPVRKGDKVVIFYASANRDEAVFPEPDRFDVGRSPNPHIGFGGGGPHFCLGSHLAKLEIQVMLRTLVERVERVELAGDVRRLRSNFINGIKEMPVRLVPASR
ncbi:MAG: cytochrome P450, partial [Mycobacteriales bacterium]